jgi:diacylglycerol kinase family enzyme
MPQAYIIYNPAAGRYPSSILMERAAGVLCEFGWKICLKKTEGGPHITELAKKAVSECMDALFVVGGDGSINWALSGLVDSQTALGVLPAGTANVWARELGLPGLTWTRLMALEESARRLAEAPVHAIDIGYCNDTPFLLWSGVGLDGFIVHRLEPRKRWEKHFSYAQYAASAVWGASSWSGMNLRAVVDGEVVLGQFLLAVVSNIHLYAGGLAEISPQARLDDGVMDLWLFAGSTLGEAVRHAWHIWAGNHVRSDQARCIPFQKLSFASDSQLYVQVDGEPVHVKGEVEIVVKSKVLRALIPNSAPRALFHRGNGN